MTIVLLVLILFLFLNKQNKSRKKCTKCGALVNTHKCSCQKCGTALSIDVYKEVRSEALSMIRMIVKKKNCFFEVKELILNQYWDLGFNNIAINKEDTFMLKDTKGAYILVELENFDLIIQTFNIDKPNFKGYNNLFILDDKVN